jgi:GNAT superfamily N-acetyltransferase
MIDSVEIKVVDENNSDFPELVKKLDAELAVIDGDDHDFYHSFNGIENLKNRIVAYSQNRAIAIGAFAEKPQLNGVEIKRMYCLPEFRGRGMGTRVLLALEQLAREKGFSKTLLETGKRQEDAVALYTKNGYQIIPNYPPYEGVENSVCFSKVL